MKMKRTIIAAVFITAAIGLILSIIFGWGIQKASTEVKNIEIPLYNIQEFMDSLEKNDSEIIPWYEEFKSIGKGSIENYRFTLFHDNTNLYIVFQSPVEKSSIEYISFFLNVNSYALGFYEFTLVSSGELKDAKYVFFNDTGAGKVKEQLVKDEEWSSYSKITRLVSKSKVTLITQIPFYSLDLTDSDEWKVNLIINNGSQGLYSLAHVEEDDIHDSSYFITTKIKDLNTENLYNFQILEEGLELIDGRLFYQYIIKLRNLTGKDLFFNLRSELVNGDTVLGTSQKKRYLSDNQELPFVLRFPVSQVTEEAQLKTVVESTDGDEVFLENEIGVSLDYSPIQLKVLKPAYRENIYHTDTIEELVLKLEVNMPENWEIDGSPFVLVKDSSGKVIQDKRNIDLDKVVSIDIKEGIGDLIIISGFRSDNGDILYPTEKRIKRLPYHKGESRLDENGILLVDGERFIPYGWLDVPYENLSLVSKQGVNVVLSYADSFRSNDSIKAYLDRAESLGIKVIFYSYPTREIMDRWTLPLSGSEKKVISDFINKWKEHPALLGWYLTDEPEYRPAFPLRLRDIFNLVKEVDPYHVAIVLNDTEEGMRVYADYCDVLMPDPYPGFIIGGGSMRPMDKVVNLVEAAKNRVGYGQTVWVTPQAFSYADFGRGNNRAPTPLEMRNMTIQAIIGGAKGFVYYSFYRSQKYSEIWTAITSISAEFEELKDAILAEPMECHIKVEPVIQGVAFSLRRVGQDLYFFVANTDMANKILTFDLSEAGIGDVKLNVVSEGRTVEVEGGILKDIFKKYESRVYTTADIK